MSSFTHGFLFGTTITIFVGIILSEIVTSINACSKKKELITLLPITKLDDFLTKLLRNYPLYFSGYSDTVKEILLNHLIIASRYNRTHLNVPDLQMIIYRILTRNYSKDFIALEIKSADPASYDVYVKTCEAMGKEVLTPDTLETCFDWDTLIERYNRNPKQDLISDAHFLLCWVTAFGKDDVKLKCGEATSGDKK